MNAEQLKEKFKEVGISQKEFADITGVHTNTVSQWVRAINEIPSWVLPFLIMIQKDKDKDMLLSKIDTTIKTLNELKEKLQK